MATLQRFGKHRKSGEGRHGLGRVALQRTQHSAAKPGAQRGLRPEGGFVVLSARDKPRGDGKST